MAGHRHPADDATGASDEGDFGDLMRRVYADEPGAFDLLIQNHCEPLLTIIRHRFREGQPKRPEFDSWDMLQSGWKALLKAKFQGRPAILDRSEFYRFFIACVHNRFVDVERHAKVEQHALGKRARFIDEDARLSSSALDPAKRAELRDRIWAAANALRPVYRDMALAALDGCTCAEIALTMRLSERTVERALAQWRASFSQETPSNTCSP
jgi:RNA polymerase sigma factor (sigma-70 family)